MSLADTLASYSYVTGSEVEVRFKLSESGIQAGIVREYVSGTRPRNTRTVSWEFLSGTGHRITRNDVSTISLSDIPLLLKSIQKGGYMHEMKTLLRSNILDITPDVSLKISDSTEECMGAVEYSDFDREHPVSVFRHKNRETYWPLGIPVKVDITSVYTVTFAGNKKPKSRWEVEIEMLPGFGDRIADITTFIHTISTLLTLPLAILNKTNLSKITAKSVYTSEKVSGMILNSIITKPVSFMRKDLATLYSSGYAVSYKADGIRCLVVSSAEYLVLVTAFSFTVIRAVSGGFFGGSGGVCPDIYDAELLINPESKTLYLFDAILDTDYPERFQKVQEFVNGLSEPGYTFIAKATAFPGPKPDFYTESQMMSLKAAGSDTPPKDDGLIFTPTTGGYYSDIPVFKWKPADKNTIDLKVVHIKHRQQQREITIGLSGPRVIPLDPDVANKVQAFTAKHTRVLITQLPLEDLISSLGITVNDIVECAWNEDLRAFIPIKKRGDKVIPNKWEVILDAIELVSDNVSIQEFCGRSPGTRGTAADTGTTGNPMTRITPFPLRPQHRVVANYDPVAYDLMNNYSDSGRNHESVMNSRIRMFHNYVKKSLFDAYTVGRSNLRVADMCCGQGSAVKFALANGCVQSLLLVDSSEKMLSEAGLRATQFNASGKASITCQCHDLRTAVIPAPDPDAKFDIVECHFALQYFYENGEYLENIIRCVAGMLTGGGVFIGIMPDGDLLNTQLLKGNGIFEAHTADTEFKITAHYRNYTSRGPGAYDRKVSVFLKESILDTIADTGVCEYLASFPLLVQTCERFGMTLTETAVLRHPYKIYQTGLKYKDPRAFLGIDKAFSFVYRYFVFTLQPQAAPVMTPPSNPTLTRMTSVGSQTTLKALLPTPFGAVIDRVSIIKVAPRMTIRSVMVGILRKRDPSVSEALVSGILFDQQCSSGSPGKPMTDAQVITGICTHFNCALIVLYQKKAIRLHKQSYNERAGVAFVIVLIEQSPGVMMIVRCDNSDIWDTLTYPYKLLN